MYIYETTDEGRIHRSPFLITESLNSHEAGIYEKYRYKYFFNTDINQWIYLHRILHSEFSDNYYIELIYLDEDFILRMNTMVCDISQYEDFKYKYLLPSYQQEYENARPYRKLILESFIKGIEQKVIKNLSLSCVNICDLIYNQFFNPFVYNENQIIHSVRGQFIDVVDTEKSFEIYIRYDDIIYQKEGRGRIISSTTTRIDEFIDTFKFNNRIFDFIFTVPSTDRSYNKIIANDVDGFIHLSKFHNEFTFKDGKGETKNIILCNDGMTKDGMYYIDNKTGLSHDISKIFGVPLTIKHR